MVYIRYCPSQVKVLTDCVKPGDAGMSDLFTAFEAMNFSPVKAMRRKAGKA